MSRRSGVISSYALLFAQVVSSLLFTPYLIRSLGQAEYGLYSLVASITAYFLLLDAGVGNALVRYIAKYRVSEDLAQQRRLLGLSLLYYIGIAFLVLVLGAMIRGYLPQIFGRGLTSIELIRAGRMLDITLLQAASLLVFSAFNRTLIAYERFVLSKGLAIVELALRVSILTALLHMGFGALTIVTVNLVLTIGIGCVSAWYVLFRIGLRPTLRGLELSFAKEVIGYSSFIFVQMIATQVNDMTDQILLGIMTTSSIIGVYAVGALLSSYFRSIAGAINGVLMPGVVRMVETGQSAQALLDEMVKVGRLVFMVMGVVLVGFAVSGRRFVSLWVGADNGEAYWVALILMVAAILTLVQSIGTQILWAMGKHKIQALLMVGVAAANLGLSILLIRWNPLVGAALGTAFAVIAGNVAAMTVVFAREMRISPQRYYAGLTAGIVPCLVVAGVAGALFSLLRLAGWSGVLIEVAVVLMVYTACMLRFGMNGYEKRLFVQALRSSRPQAAR
ncbi:MAG: oligosaccharide flippase family protein [Coriobacteriia bacterium]